MKHKTSATSILAALLLIQSCGAADYASQLRLILAGATPLINSLPLGDKKQAVIQDFADLASGASDLSVDLKACTDKPCKLNAVDRFQIRFFDIERRGHFKLSPKLQNIEGILQGIIQAAKIYYGPQTATASVGAANPEKVLSDRIAQLKAEMRVK